MCARAVTVAHAHCRTHVVAGVAAFFITMSTVKEGTLFKKGRINTEWRERLFVLNKKQLAYFKGSVSISCIFFFD